MCAPSGPRPPAPSTPVREARASRQLLSWATQGGQDHLRPSQSRHGAAPSGPRSTIGTLPHLLLGPPTCGGGRQDGLSAATQGRVRKPEDRWTLGHWGPSCLDPVLEASEEAQHRSCPSPPDSGPLHTWIHNHTTPATSIAHMSHLQSHLCSHLSHLPHTSAHTCHLYLSHLCSHLSHLCLHLPLVPVTPAAHTCQSHLSHL